MHIQHIEIRNFRKLKAVRIDLAEKTTIFVGANNSGKTSAMVAMQRFFVDHSEFAIHDFTLSHWATINAAARLFEQAAPEAEIQPFDWAEVLPCLDVWLQVPIDDLHYVRRLLPTLDWDGTHIGVRLRFQPKDPQALRQEYLKAKLMAAERSWRRASSPSRRLMPLIPHRYQTRWKEVCPLRCGRHR